MKGARKPAPRAAAAAPSPARRRRPARALVQTPAAAATTTPTSGVAGEGETLVQRAANNTLAMNPVIGLRLADLGRAAATLVGATVRTPLRTGRHLGAYASTLLQIGRGRKQLAADPKDKRFADPAWRSSGLYRRLLGAHLAAQEQLNRYIDDSGLDTRNKERARLVAQIYMDAVAPSNSLLHPAALKRVIDTGGLSLVAGARNLWRDIRSGNGLPLSVDKSAFEFGRDLCTTPGAVVFKNEVLELLQYQGSSERVWRRPLMLVPSQVNKFYSLDLAPEKSFIRYAGEQGINAFAVSWRNPSLAHRDWNISTYVQALDEAVDAMRQITGSPDITMWGACAGGMTVAAYLGHMAAVGHRKVANTVLPVSVLDSTHAMDTTMGLFVTPQSLQAVRKAVARKGYVDGKQMAQMFAWLRPNDLIWNYWVNNYLLGQNPPAFDVLYWNADSTRLPAGFHADMMTVMESNPFNRPGTMQVLGRPIDMRKLEVEAYVVGGTTDHITPWRPVYESARILSRKATFVLASAGHLQALLSPPASTKGFYMTGIADVADPDAWAAAQTRVEGSWWPHWVGWMASRSGESVPRPAKLGSRRHPPLSPAPGTYIHEP